MGILDAYKKQLLIDKENENDDFPFEMERSEEHKKEYVKKLNELRKNIENIEYKTPNPEELITRAVGNMVNLTEEKMEEEGTIVSENISDIRIKHAYCTCGKELLSDAPPMFNPYTMQKICKHVCKECGKTYNLEFAYPRLAFYSKEGVEIPAFTR